MGVGGDGQYDAVSVLDHEEGSALGKIVGLATRGADVSSLSVVCKCECLHAKNYMIVLKLFFFFLL